MVFSKNKIIIHIPPRVYFSGDTIYGVVEVIIKSKIKSRGVRFLFAAVQHAHTQVGKHHYEETLVFLSYRLDLMGTPRHLRKDAKAEELERGVYRFPFAVVLPQHLPSIYKNYSTFIRYRATAYVDIPLGFDLTGHVDLRIDGNQADAVPFSYLMPSGVKVNKKSFIFASGKLHMTGSLQTINYFVGDVARISLKVENDSKKNVDDIKIVLWKATAHRACGVTNAYHDRVHKQKYSKFIAKDSNDEFLLEFPIPYLLPSIHTVLIESVYYIEIRLDVPWAVDLKLTFPIEIMARDPKFAHLIPPAGPLLRPSPKKYFEGDMASRSYVPDFPEFQVMSPYIPDPQLHVQNFPPPVPVPGQQAIYTQAPAFIAPNYDLLIPRSAQSPPTSPTQQPPAPAFDPILAQEQAAAATTTQNNHLQPVSLKKETNNNNATGPDRRLSRPVPVENAPSAPLYPALEGYEYPANINAAIVPYGHYQVDDDERSLIKG